MVVVASLVSPPIRGASGQSPRRTITTTHRRRPDGRLILSVLGLIAYAIVLRWVVKHREHTWMRIVLVVMIVCFLLPIAVVVIALVPHLPTTY
jgi:hypothetical protein